MKRLGRRKVHTFARVSSSCAFPKTRRLIRRAPWTYASLARFLGARTAHPSSRRGSDDGTRDSLRNTQTARGVPWNAQALVPHFADATRVHRRADVPRRRGVHELPLTLKTHACGSGHRIPNPKPLAQAVVKEREARTASHRHICETAASSSKKKEDGSQNPKIKNHKNKRLLQRPEIGAQTQRAHRYRRGIRPLPTHSRESSTGSSVADYASQPEI
jgi:hypothetical protein